MGTAVEYDHSKIIEDHFLDITRHVSSYIKMVAGTVRLYIVNLIIMILKPDC